MLKIFFILSLTTLLFAKYDNCEFKNKDFI